MHPSLFDRFRSHSAKLSGLRTLSGALLAFLLWASPAEAQVARYVGRQVVVDSSLSGPQGLAVDGAGDFYVVDPGNNRIVQETPSGAGTYTQTAIPSSLFSQPFAVAVDAAHNLYVVNHGSGTLVKLSLSGTTYTGSVLASGLGAPTGVAVTADGTALYVADPTDNKLFQFAYNRSSYIQQATVTSGLTRPSGVAVDASNAFYVLANGTVTRHAAGFAAAAYTGTTLASNFNQYYAYGLAVDAAGDLFVVDSSTGQVTEDVLSGTSTYTPLALTSSAGSSYGVAVDSNGVVAFSNQTANLLYTLTPGAPNFGSVALGKTSAAQTLSFSFTTGGTLNGTAPLQTVLAGGATQEYQVVPGSGTSCTAGAAFATNSTCTVSVTFTPKFPGARSGAALLNGSGGAQAGLAYLSGVGVGPEVAYAPTQNTVATSQGDQFSDVAVDGAGNVYASVPGECVYKEVYSSGAYTQSPLCLGSYLYTLGLAVDGAGNLFLFDGYTNQVVEEVYSNGVYTQSPVSIGTFSTGNNHNSITIDGSGNLYVVDTNGGRVVKETYAGGSYTQSTITSGSIQALDIAVDSAGNVYVVDSSNDRILKETYSAGTYSQSVISTSFSAPSGIAVDAAGSVYVSDLSNGQIIREIPSGGSYTPSPVTIGGLGLPLGLTIDAAGNLYVAESGKVVVESVQAPPALSFAAAAAGATSADSPRSVVLLNTGNAPMTVSSVTVSTQNFSVNGTACLTAPLAAGGSCSVAYSYTPQTLGVQSGSSTLTDNTLGVTGSLQTAALTGAAATRGTQSISFPQPASTGSYVAGTVIALNATSSAGLPITYGAEGLNVNVSVSGNLLTLLSGSGQVIVSATQAGNSSYSAAAAVTDYFTATVVGAPVSGTPLGSTALGSSSTATVGVQIAAGGAIASAQGLTQGNANQDFATSLAGGSCAAGSQVTAGQYCTLTVTFSPTQPGLRLGAANLLDAGGNILGTALIQGIGLGPLVAFNPVPRSILPSNSSLQAVDAIAVDAAGDVFVTDPYNKGVLEEVKTGNTYKESPVVIGSGFDTYILGLAIDGAGNLYVSDYTGNRVVKEVNQGGIYTQSATAIGTGLSGPTQVAVDAAGNLFIVDRNNHRVLRESPGSGGYTQTVVASAVSVTSLALDAAGSVYLAINDSVVYRYTYSNGVYTQSANPVSPGGPQIALDGDANLYYQTGENLYQSLNHNGTYVAGASYAGTGAYTLFAVDATGNLYATDDHNELLMLPVTAPPTLAFPALATGTTSAPMATTVTNLGNQPLIFPAPASGVNPQTSANFALERNADTTCPVVSAGSAAGQLAASTSCTLSYLFTPAQIGPITGSGLLTDNSLNTPGSLQSILLSGISTAPAAQTITFPQPVASGTLVPGATLTLNASASSGLAVVYTLQPSAGLTVALNGSVVTITSGSGSFTVTATQPGNAYFLSAPVVTYSFKVAAPATIPAAAVTLADTAVGSSFPATVNVTVTAGGKLQTAQALVQGIANLDYATSLTGSGCSAAQAVTVGQVCALKLTFSPTRPGARPGALQLLDASGNLLGQTLLQGNGLGPQAAFAYTQSTAASGLSLPGGVVVDAAGNLYIADTSNARVIKESYTGGSYTATVIATSSIVGQPISIAQDGAGNLYVGDSVTLSVTKLVYANGVYTPVPTGIGNVYPAGAAVDGAGTLFVADQFSRSVLKEVPQPGGGYTLAALLGSGNPDPAAVTVDIHGVVFLSDVQNSRVLKETPVGDGTYAETAIDGINNPGSLAEDAAGDVYVAHNDGSQVLKETPTAAGGYAASVLPIAPGVSLEIEGLALDANGTLYLADVESDTVLMESVTTPPALAFPSLPTGTISAPVATTLLNVGNQPLTLPAPSSGLNPLTSANFALETNSDTTCPVLPAGAASAQLSPGAGCTLSFVFTPGQTGLINGSSMLTDNNLNGSNAMQTIALQGAATQGTQAAQTITFPLPASTVYPGTTTLSATASSGLPVSYTVTSGPAGVIGSLLTYTGPGTLILTATQAGNAQFAAAPAVSLTLNVTQSLAMIDWQPSTLKIYTGTLLGTSILDAMDTIPSTITYTASLLPTGSALAVSPTTLLTQGSYGLSALITPQDALRYGIVSDTLLFTVQNMNVFVGNATGATASLYNNGTIQTAAVQAGGIGEAVDSGGSVWSINQNGSGVSRFTDAGVLAASFNGLAGINSATALAIDGQGRVWIANGNGTVSALNNDGSAAIGATPVAAAANLNAPASISVDTAGSLWIANAGNNTVTEVIGVAAPTAGPIVNAVITNTLGMRP